MTAQEFDNIEFSGLTIIEYSGKKHFVKSVDFEERLIAYNTPLDEDLKWVRCENCKIIVT